jgi:hypothetical protein
VPARRASGRSHTKVANASLISRLLLALSTWIWSPMVRAAASTFRIVDPKSGLVGLTSTATRAAAGSNSCRSSSRFVANSSAKKLTPVRLPPGRARLATKPSLTGSSPATKTIGISVVAALAAIAEA